MSKSFACGRLFKMRKFNKIQLDIMSDEEPSFNDMQNYNMGDLSMNSDSDSQFIEEISDHCSEDISINNSEDDQLSLTQNQLALE